MKSCEYNEILVDYLDGELSPSERKKIEQHIDGCAVCTKQLQDLTLVRDALKQVQRPEPSPVLRQRYESNLRKMFSAGPGISGLWERTKVALNRSFWPRSVGVRIAGAVTLVIIGIAIGRFAFQLSSDSSKIVLKPYILNTPVTHEDVNIIHDFLYESEVLLLDMMNSPVGKDSVSMNLVVSKEIAQRLLIRAFFIHEKALKLNNENVLQFLKSFEVLLYEISNAKPEDLNRVLNQLRQIIRDADLLDRARLLQKVLDGSLVQLL